MTLRLVKRKLKPRNAQDEEGRLSEVQECPLGFLRQEDAKISRSAEADLDPESHMLPRAIGQPCDAKCKDAEAIFLASVETDAQTRNLGVSSGIQDSA